MKLGPSILLIAAGIACSSGRAPEPAPQRAPATQAPEGSSSRPTAGGKVRTETFTSAALGVDKDYVVYLPAGYDDKPAARWPVFFYLHGLGGNEDNWVKGGEIDQAADKLGLQAIIVMPDGDDSFYADALAKADYEACMKDGTGLLMPGRQSKRKTCVRKRDYSTYITKDLIAHVDATYRTLATRDGRAIAGLSMGGFGALQLAMRHPQLFAAAASHSGVVSLLYNGPIPYQPGKVELLQDAKAWGGPLVEVKRWMLGVLGKDLTRWRAHDPTTLLEQLQPGTLALYVDCGTEDVFTLNNHAAYLHDLLVARKLEHEFFLGPGRHDFAFWKVRVAESLRFLRDHTTKPQ